MQSDSDALVLRRLLDESGARQQGHFRLSSGRHSPDYVQCALLLEDPARASRVGEMLAARLGELRPQSVLSPALGGLIIGYQVAAALGVPFRFCERRAGGMQLRRGFELRPEERLVVIEDVITTGGSAAEAATLAERAGAEVVAIGSIIVRSADRAWPTPTVGLLHLGLTSWEAGECPLCAEGLPLTAPGSRSSG
jgi:orotate phosphoribosyltransferase